MPEVHAHDQPWLDKQLYGIPAPFKDDILRKYQSLPTRREANLSVLQVRKQIAAILGKDDHSYSINIEDKDFKQAAKIHAKHCLLIQRNNVEASLPAIYHLTTNYITTQAIKPHKLPAKTIAAIECGTFDNQDLTKVKGVLARAKDPDWWRKQLKTQHLRQIESLARLFNQVNRKRGIYISNIAKGYIENRWADNKAFLEDTIATNEDGYSASLAELSSLNVSNPRLRRAELMTRVRGFEDCATNLGHQALFLTITTPSKYHRSLSLNGSPNPKWNGATPLEGQAYLRKTFELIRTSLSNQKIRLFGFRVAEPHHDGTPHWHLLLFVKKQDENALIETFTKYCFAEDGNEPGAAKHRFTVERIDPDKGSATGYIAKYISKNIDGEGIDEDSYGQQAKESAKRVKAWASCWGIRQFQQLGGVGVSVWRELRRLGEITDKSLNWIEQIRKACDAGDWQVYTELMGGVFCKREDQTIRPLYQAAMETKRNPESLQEQCWNSDNRVLQLRESTKLPVQEIRDSVQENPEIKTSEFVGSMQEFLGHSGTLPKPKTNRYGDEALTRLKGIMSFGVEIITRLHEWTLSAQSKSEAGSPNRFSLEYCQ